jgi:hypothetical protein
LEGVPPELHDIGFGLTYLTSNDRV